MKPEIRVCPISNQPLPPHMHGNTKYHPGFKKTAKSQSNHKRYAAIKDISNNALQLERILEKHYPHSHNEVSIDKSLLVKDGFAWDFNSRITVINNKPVFWIINYGYSFTDQSKKKVTIYYGPTTI
jgi:hypothetical protein